MIRAVLVALATLSAAAGPTTLANTAPTTVVDTPRSVTVTTIAEANAALNELRTSSRGGTVVVSGVANWRPVGYDFAAHPVTLVGANGTAGFYARALKGFIFRGIWLPTALIPWAIRCDNCAYLTLDHTELMSKSSEVTYYGALLSGVTHVDINGAYVHDLDSELVINGASFLHIFGGTLLRHIGNDGIDVGGPSSSDITIEDFTEDEPQWNSRAHPDGVQVSPNHGAHFTRIVIRRGKITSAGQGVFLDSLGTDLTYSETAVLDNDITCAAPRGISEDRVIGGSITGNRLHTLAGAVLPCIDAGAAHSSGVNDHGNRTDGYTTPTGRIFKSASN